jgi:hypothetical protein
MLCFCSVSGLVAQTIIKVQSGYVLIDTDRDIGGMKQRLHIYRVDQGQLMHVGFAQTVAFRNGKTAAVILKEHEGFKMKVGDFISLREIDAVDMAGVVAAHSGGKTGAAEAPVQQTDGARSDLDPQKPLVEKPADRTSTQQTGQPAGQSATSASRTGENRQQVRPRGYSTGSSRRLMHLGLWGGVHVPATLQTKYHTSPTFGLAVRFFGRSRYSMILDITRTFLNPQPNATVSTDALTSLMANFRVGAGLFIKYDLGIGLVFDEGAAFGANLGLSIDFPMFFMIFSPTVRLTLYKGPNAWEGFALGGIAVYFGVL